jgi:hypothetical protein
MKLLPQGHRKEKKIQQIMKNEPITQLGQVFIALSGQMDIYFT